MLHYLQNFCHQILSVGRVAAASNIKTSKKEKSVDSPSDRFYAVIVNKIKKKGIVKAQNERTCEHEFMSRRRL